MLKGFGGFVVSLTYRIDQRDMHLPVPNELKELALLPVALYNSGRKRLARFAASDVAYEDEWCGEGGRRSGSTAMDCWSLGQKWKVCVVMRGNIQS